MYRRETFRWHYAVAGAACLGALLPFVWLFGISLNPTQGIALPHGNATARNYVAVLVDSGMARYFFNTALVAAATVVLTLACALLGAYAASRYRFAGKEWILMALLASSMIPVIAVLVPLYALVAKAHLLNTYAVLIFVFSSWQVPAALWLIRSFLDDIPFELDEAAQVDGCSRVSAFIRIVLPLLGPGLISAGIVIFVYVWNEFIIAVSLAAKQDMRLVAVGLYFYVTEFGVEWGKIAAGAILAVIPVMIVFFVLQRRLISGLTAGAIK